MSYTYNIFNYLLDVLAVALDAAVVRVLQVVHGIPDAVLQAFYL